MNECITEENFYCKMWKSGLIKAGGYMLHLLINYFCCEWLSITQQDEENNLFTCWKTTKKVC